MTTSTRSCNVRVMTWLIAGAPMVFACGSTNSTPSQDLATMDGGGGSGTGGSSSTTAGGAGGASAGTGGAGGASVGTGGSSATAGAAGAGASGGPHDGGPATCDSDFKSAVSKDCTSNVDCTLANHSDCCGTVVIGIRKGTDAVFSTAEKAFQSCVPGCGLRGCFHPTTAEDGNMVSMVGQAIFARCENNKCASVVAVAPACVATRDCAVGQICVTFASGLPNAAARQECRSNPCGAGETPTCTCAATVCSGFGAGLCSANGSDLTCRDGLK
jgi:hypothetical protein